MYQLNFVRKSSARSLVGGLSVLNEDICTIWMHQHQGAYSSFLPQSKDTGTCPGYTLPSPNVSWHKLQVKILISPKFKGTRHSKIEILLISIISGA